MYSSKHWGEWIRQRAYVCGYPTQKALAAAVQVTPKVVAHWWDMEFPFRLRRSSIEALAKTLDTHPEVISSRYVEYNPNTPDDVPTEDEYKEELYFANATYELMRRAKAAGYAELASELADRWLQHRINTYLEVISGAELLQVCDLCYKLAKSAMLRVEEELAECGGAQFDAEAEHWHKTTSEQRKKLIEAIDKTRKTE